MQYDSDETPALAHLLTQPKIAIDRETFFTPAE
jgi:hypothetical protein